MAFRMIVLTLIIMGSSLMSGAGSLGATPGPGVTRIAFASDAQESGGRSEFRAAIERFDRAGASMLLYGGDTSLEKLRDVPDDWVDALGPYAEEGRTLLVLGSHDSPEEGHRRFIPGNDTWWVLDIGGVVVIGLDTSDSLAPGSAQEAWLIERLREYGDRFVLLALHIAWWVPPAEGRPPEALFPHDPAFFDDLVVQYDVDLVLAAHEHYYSRMERLGATFVVAGPVEAHIRPVPREVQEVSKMAASQRMSMLMDVSACGIRAEVIDENGQRVDAFEVPLLDGTQDPRSLAGQGLACEGGDATPRFAAAPRGVDASDGRHAFVPTPNALALVVGVALLCVASRRSAALRR